MKTVSATATATIRASRQAVFDHIVPIDLTTIFRGYGPLPAVIGTKGQTGAWDGVGQTRTVVLSDGSTAREELTAYEPPRYFAYRVGGFTNALRLLSTGARGEWWFEETAGDTSVRWRYVFEPTSMVVLPFLAPIGLIWQRYMQAALNAAKASAERLSDTSGQT